MVYTIFISIVFIAELIIAVTILYHLFILDKKLTGADKYLNDVKPKIKYIMKIGHKISEQLAELAPYWVEEIKTFLFQFLMNNIKGMLAGVALYSLKKRWKIKRIRGLKLVKLIRFLTA